MLDEIPGIGLQSAQRIIAETGIIMEQFRSADAFASWAGLVPGCNESAGKMKHSRIRKGNKFLKTVLVECSRASIRHKDSYYYAKYCKIAARRGGKRALVAIAHTMALAIYNILLKKEHFHDLGYETACNIMAVSQANSDQLAQALEMLAATNVDVIYLVDSYGSLYPENASELAKKYVAAVEGTGKQIGFHAHNNQNLAFANTIETMSYGLSFMDATMQGIGRGAGNCSIELLVGFLKNPKYNIYHLLKFIEKHMPVLRAQGVHWGYDLQYMLTGLLNRHPKEAIEFTNEERTDYAEFYKILLENH